MRAAEDKLSEATRAAQTVAAQRAELRTAITELKGKLQATDAALRDHAGAELPQLEERLTELHDAARQRRDDLDDDAQLTARAAQEALEQAASGQRHLKELVAHLLPAAEVGAQAFVDRIADSSDQLTSSKPGSPVTLTGLAQLAGTPHSWVQARLDVLQRIDTALRELDIAREGQRGAAAQVRAAAADRDRYDQTCRASRHRAPYQRSGTRRRRAAVGQPPRRATRRTWTPARHRRKDRPGRVGELTAPRRHQHPATDRALRT
ncbi:hypothetical protein [Actinoplanes sp. NPDC051494]|uniref:hypothetical protein n=1 Tax=Actinoplanes sp. NPDC051494 TaxID=3363907 RepID=UPI00379EC03C